MFSFVEISVFKRKGFCFDHARATISRAVFGIIKESSRMLGMNLTLRPKGILSRFELDVIVSRTSLAAAAFCLLVKMHTVLAKLLA